ncbi:MAG: hypothetical protein JWO15_3599 [Sphingomonadales bacterium]|nr:hypothetical protein [Sphingomonadales bacterium]
MQLMPTEAIQKAKSDALFIGDYFKLLFTANLVSCVGYDYNFAAMERPCIEGEIEWLGFLTRDIQPKKKKFSLSTLFR